MDCSGQLLIKLPDLFESMLPAVPRSQGEVVRFRDFVDAGHFTAGVAQSLAPTYRRMIPSEKSEMHGIYERSPLVGQVLS